jgi:hypothetical protein
MDIRFELPPAQDKSQVWVNQLDETIDTTKYWNTSVYDLSWVILARLDEFTADEQQAFIERLITAQNPDGSWGDASIVPQSALVDTLAALLALTDLAGQSAESVFDTYIRQALTILPELMAQSDEYAGHEPVGYELITPLMWKAVMPALIVRYNFIPSENIIEYMNDVESQGRRKIHLTRQEGGLFINGATTEFSAEISYLLDKVDILPINELTQLRSLSNPLIGGVGLSPAATAGVSMTLKAHGIEVPASHGRYLRIAYEDSGKEGFPNLYPFSNTARLWQILPALLSGEIYSLMENLDVVARLALIYEEFPTPATGWSWDNRNPHLPDLDDTAIAFALYNLLISQGVTGLKPMTLDTLQQFRYPDGTFFCYYLERNSAPTHLLHTFMSLEIANRCSGGRLAMNPYYQEMYESLRRQVNGKAYALSGMLDDKWVASQEYTAQRWASLETLVRDNPIGIKMILQKLIDEQSPEGGWGKTGALVEPTTYAFQALLQAVTNLDKIGWETVGGVYRPKAMQSMVTARSYLQEVQQSGVINAPAHWLSKDTYTPIQIVSASMINTINQFDKVDDLQEP